MNVNAVQRIIYFSNFEVFFKLCDNISYDIDITQNVFVYFDQDFFLSVLIQILKTI